MGKLAKKNKWLVCVDCQKGFHVNDVDSDKCPSCGTAMRPSHKKPSFVMSLENIGNVAKWASGDYNLFQNKKEEIQRTLIGSENKTAIVKKMIQVNRMNRLARLLQVQEDVENNLFRLEELEKMEPKEKLRLLELMQRAVRDTKEFVYGEQEENVLEVVMGGFQQDESKITMKSSSRESMRFMFQETKNLLSDDNLMDVLEELSGELDSE